MKRVALMAGLLVVAAGCQGAATRAWQQAALPTHDRQRAFDAALEVFERHFDVARSSYASGTIETRPQVFDKRREGTLADIRGAGGRWRRTASFEMDRDGLTIVGCVAVRLEREATTAAVAISESSGDRADELPRVGAQYTRPSTQASEQVWVEVGYDAQMARELLAAIADRVRVAERGEAVPEGQSPRDAAEETRRLGAERDP